MTISQNIRYGLRGGLLFFASAILVVISVAVMAPTQKATAAGCRHYTTTAATPVDWSNPYAWQYADTVRVPYSTACHDINIDRTSIEVLNGGVCAAFRVRFYPSAGGSYTNNPTVVCTGYGSDELATWVRDGTKYRVEADRTVRFHIFD